jgi:hypothetical protein
MKVVTRLLLGSVFATAVIACSDDGTSPERCRPETAIVSPAVTAGQTLTFTWEPACGVAMLLIEEGAADRWLVATPEQSWSSPDQANRILPPVTYGQVPPGVAQGEAPATLVTGRTYELVLWRVLPQGSTAQCIQRLESLCLSSVHEFQR